MQLFPFKKKKKKLKAQRKIHSENSIHKLKTAEIQFNIKVQQYMEFQIRVQTLFSLCLYNHVKLYKNNLFPA